MRAPLLALLLVAPLGFGLFLAGSSPLPEALGASAARAPLPAGPILDCDPACNVRVTTVTGPANEVHIAANPRDPDNLVAVAKDYALGGEGACRVRNVWAGAYHSMDGGRTWANQLIPGHPGDDPTLLSAYQCSSDPVVAFDGEGRAFYGGLSLQPPPLLDFIEPYHGWSTALWVGRSDDGGATWGDFVFAALGPGPYPAAFHDKQWVATDPASGRVYLAWSIFSGIFAHIFVAASPDGLLWGPPLKVATFDLGCGSGIGAAPFVGPSGELYVGWLGCGQVLVARSDDGGLTFGPFASAGEVDGISTPNSPHRIPTMPAFAVDTSPGPFRGAVFAAWQDGRLGGSDILVARSLDRGASFEAPMRVTDDPVGSDNVQFFPALATGPDGSVHATWYDRRDDPANYRVGAYYARSLDGGLTWSPNMRVTTQDFDPALSGHQNGYVFLGDYNGLAVGADGVAHPVWADTRTGRADVFTARILP